MKLLIIILLGLVALLGVWFVSANFNDQDASEIPVAEHSPGHETPRYTSSSNDMDRQVVKVRQGSTGHEFMPGEGESAQNADKLAVVEQREHNTKRRNWFAYIDSSNLASDPFINQSGVLLNDEQKASLDKLVTELLYAHQSAKSSLSDSVNRIGDEMIERGEFDSMRPGQAKRRGPFIVVAKPEFDKPMRVTIDPELHPEIKQLQTLLRSLEISGKDELVSFFKMANAENKESVR